MRYLDKLEESSKKKVEKARKLERQARAGTAPKGRAYKAAYDAASSISRGRVKGVAKAVNSLINQRRSELSEAKKRGYTSKEIDAYARGREKATMDKRKKEFEDFYSKPKKKKPELEEAKVDKGKPYGEKKRARSKRDFERAYQHASDTGEGKVGKMIRSKDSRKTKVLAAKARRKAGEGDRPLAKLAMKEAYTLLGDTLAEAMLGEARVNKKIEKSTEAMGRYIRGDRRDDQTPETARGRALKAGEDLTAGQKRAMNKEALALRAKDKRKRVAGKLRTSANKTYKDAEVGEASGESPKSVAKKSARAHKRMKTAQDIENKS